MHGCQMSATMDGSICVRICKVCILQIYGPLCERAHMSVLACRQWEEAPEKWVFGDEAASLPRRLKGPQGHIISP